MDESLRNQIIRMWYGKASGRRIAKPLGISRKTVHAVIDEHEQARAGTLPKRGHPPQSVLDPFREPILALLARYPDITVVRLHQELARLGFQGAYSTVRDYFRQFRPSDTKPPV